jgi:protein-L-isoaspartate(D-aspartate) O-methyltransferase
LGVKLIPDWAVERREMVESQLRRRHIRDERVLRAMQEIPREEFVPADVRLLACQDDPIDIGYWQTISQPYMTALMAEALELEGHETVLEVGAGCGYAAAVLGALTARVISVEIIPALAHMARENLRKTGRDRNVTVVLGDGSLGYQELAPYDAISVAAGAPDIPPALLEQLKDPGRLVIPVGERYDQELRVLWKKCGRIDDRVVTWCRFVPLRGGEGWQ